MSSRRAKSFESRDSNSNIGSRAGRVYPGIDIEPITAWAGQEVGEVEGETRIRSKTLVLGKVNRAG